MAIPKVPTRLLGGGRAESTAQFLALELEDWERTTLGGVPTLLSQQLWSSAVNGTGWSLGHQLLAPSSVMGWAAPSGSLIILVPPPLKIGGCVVSDSCVQRHGIVQRGMAHTQSRLTQELG